jgi:hypothetical protein
MAQIIIRTEPTDDRPATVVTWQERVLPTDLESQHFSDQLIERVTWAVRDAEGQRALGKAAALRN